MNTRQQDVVISRKEIIQYYAHSKYNSHIGRTVSQAMIDYGYNYNQVAARSGLNDSNNVQKIATGLTYDPKFSSIVKLAKGLNLNLEDFVEKKLPPVDHNTYMQLLLGGALISLYDRNSDNTSTRIQIGDEMFRLNLERLDDV